MSGNADNTSLWANADVYIAPALTAGPTDLTTAWPAAFEAVGLLDGDKGFDEARDEDTSEFYAWGNVLYKRTRSKHKRTVKFSALEDNEVVFNLINPGSESTATGGVRTRKVKAPTTDRFTIGFETIDGDKVKRRVGQAEVSEVADVTDSQSDPTVYEITILFFPDADGVLYTDILPDTESASA